MPRALLALFAVFLLLAAPVHAEEPKAEEEAPIPELADKEELKEAIDAYKTEYKAKGMKGEEKLAYQVHAIRTLAEVQHPKVVDMLVKLTKNKNPDIAAAALIGLGDQRRIPGYAGQAVVKVMTIKSKDATTQMAGLAAISNLKYFGAKDVITKLMGHHDYAVKKNALVTIGKLKDERFIEEIVKLMKELKLEKGAKWDGVNVTYDTGTAGDGDQKMAEKIGKAQEAKNKKKGKRAARSQRDIGPVVLELMFDLTGERFTGGIAARKWLNENRKDVDAKAGARKAQADEQAAEAKASKKLR